MTVLSRQEYLEWRTEAAAAYRDDHRNGSPRHLCTRCNECEVAGSYCSNCRTAEYTLIAHRHTEQDQKCRVGRDAAVVSEGEVHHPARRSSIWPSYRDRDAMTVHGQGSNTTGKR